MAKLKEKPAKKTGKTGPSRQVNTLLDDDDDAGVEEFFPDDEEDDAPPKAKKDKGKKAKKGDDTPEKVHRPAPVTVPRRTVSLDGDRKLTAKDKASLAGWTGANRGKTVDSFFARQAAEARKKFGHKSVFLGSESETLVIGIPCPALAFEYVIAQDCFPLGLVMQIVAKHGVGKSGLLAEFGRWFDLAGGGMVLCENETKFNPHWYTSIMGKEVYDRMVMHRCKSVEGWQRHLTFGIKNMRADMMGTKEKPGPGRSFPVLFGVDSIMGKMSEENQEKIVGKAADPKKGKKGSKPTTGEGFAQARSFPIEAGSITKYMRTVPQLMDDWPFSLVLINHLRMKTDDMGNAERNKTGGEQVNFQESFELEIKKIGGHAKKIAAADFEGVPLQISCEKNSFGPTGRKIQVRLLWWHEPDPITGRPFQKTVWDWDWATVHLLNSLLNGDASTYLKAKLKKMDFHIDITSAGDVDNGAWSETLGMKEKEALTWSEVGAMIREDDKLMDQLRDALGIARRPLLTGDYMKQLSKLAKGMP